MKSTRQLSILMLPNEIVIELRRLGCSFQIKYIISENRCVIFIVLIKFKEISTKFKNLDDFKMHDLITGKLLSLEWQDGIQYLKSGEIR